MNSNNNNNNNILTIPVKKENIYLVQNNTFKFQAFRSNLIPSNVLIFTCLSETTIIVSLKK